VAKKKGREREGEAKEKRRRRRRERRRRDGEEKGCVDTEKENKVKNRWKRKKTEDHKRTWKKAHNNHHHKQRNFCLRERMEHISGVNTEVETKWECAKREGPQLSGRAWAQSSVALNRVGGAGAPSFDDPDCCGDSGHRHFHD